MHPKAGAAIRGDVLGPHICAGPICHARGYLDPMLKPLVEDIPAAAGERDHHGVAAGVKDRRIDAEVDALNPIEAPTETEIPEIGFEVSVRHKIAGFQLV